LDHIDYRVTARLNFLELLAKTRVESFGGYIRSVCRQCL